MWIIYRNAPSTEAIAGIKGQLFQVMDDRKPSV